MPIETFNQSIKDLQDNILFTIKPQNYSRIEFINIQFDRGYEDAQSIRLVINDDTNLNLGLFIDPNHNPANKVIPLGNKTFEFNNSDIILKIISDKPFKFNLNYIFK